ncbi:TonB-dependent receptor domain-containing protein [Mucilaginibacter sp. KACC 22063]|uniref:TonB-dependent receptor domain-containing protein n=1 Tax=Mucilaginibacter sp. KACC 22063 TaxID=3025666 RepID=UPI002366054C|nr:outer membrane beta-barrel family protein [Mucilaginibacter sp. KACC 22063]WDF56035.1 outer membrane beta-barrel family protein [Mucilaginibacter sp. KACC 22063]
MRNTILKILIAVVLPFTSAMAQKSGTVTGHLFDGQQKPVEFASVHLLAAKDSAMVTGTMSEINTGAFTFKNIAPGNYIVRVSYIGYDRQFKNIALQQGETLNIDIKLNASVKALAGVVISGKRPLIEAKSDRIVFNISNTVFGSGYDAIQLLEKAPGIYVNPQSESISLNGKQGTTVMVDGKKTYLAGSDLAAFLKSFQSNTIDKIEIISNPGAKYDAQGGGGIINIITKKASLDGTTGTINAGVAVGQSKRTNEGFSINHKSGKVIIYGGYNFSYRNSRSKEQLELDYLNPQNANEVTNIHNSYTYSPYKTYAHNYRVGLDFNASPKTAFNILFTGFNFKKNLYAYSNTNILQAANVVDSVLNNNTFTKDNKHQYSGNLSFKHSIDSTKIITAEVNYSAYNSSQFNNIENTYTIPGSAVPIGGLDLRNNLPTKINIWVAKTDYEQSLGKGKLEAGLKFSTVNTDNNAQYELFNNNQWVNDPTRSNYFKYKESISAGYAVYSNKLGTYEYKLGLRGELTNSDGNLVTTQNVVKRQYFNLFPSLILSKDINKDNSLNLSYSRRINRPSYQDLNPFIYFMDIYTYSQGNPFLKPEYTNTIDLTYTLKNTYVASAGYSVTSSTINYVTQRETDDSRITRISAQNLKNLYQYYINFTIPIEVAKWLSIYNNINISHLEYQKNDVSQITNSGFYGVYGISNYFKLPDHWQPQLSGYFQSSMPSGIYHYSPQYQVTLGLQKSFDKGPTLRLTYNDVFKSARAKSVAVLPDLITRDVYRWDSNFLQFSISYPFGSKKIKPSNKNSAGDEQSRIK